MPFIHCDRVNCDRLRDLIIKQRILESNRPERLKRALAELFLRCCSEHVEAETGGLALAAGTLVVTSTKPRPIPIGPRSKFFRVLVIVAIASIVVSFIRRTKCTYTGVRVPIPVPGGVTWRCVYVCNNGMTITKSTAGGCPKHVYYEY